VVSRSTLAHIDTPPRWAPPFPDSRGTAAETPRRGPLGSVRGASKRRCASREDSGCAAGHALPLQMEEATAACPWAMGRWAASRRRRALARAEASGRARVATAAGHATAARACSELCVFTNTPSTRGTVAGGPDFLVLLITAMYAWLLVACRPRSAVACDRPAGRRRDCRQQWAH
jgi:hypothetical protein